VEIDAKMGMHTITLHVTKPHPTDSSPREKLPTDPSPRSKISKSRSEADSISDLSEKEKVCEATSLTPPPVLSPSANASKPTKKAVGLDPKLQLDLSRSPAKLSLEDDRLLAPRNSNASRRGSAPAVIYMDNL
jgi:hypothetical protein